MKTLCLIVTLFFSINALAKLTLQTALNYTSDTDNDKTFEYTRLNGSLFIGASIGKKDRLYLGQNVSQYTRTDNQDDTESAEISVLEIGPKMVYYFNDTKTIYFQATWNPYAQGDSSGAESKEISGWSYQVGVGYQLRVSRGFHLGASLNYHALNISEEKTSDGQATEVSKTYSSILPMIELALHFR